MAANGKAADDGRVTDLANAVNTRLTDLAPPFAISDVTGLQTELDAPPGGFRKWWSGWYYGPEAGTYTTFSTNPSQQTQHWVPIWVPKTADIDRIGLEITTGGAGPTVTLMIYNSTADDAPGNLVLTAGTIDPSTTGFKEIAISQSLTAGLWWLSVHTTDKISFRAVTGALPPVGYTSGTTSGGLPRNAYVNYLAGIVDPAVSPATVRLSGNPYGAPNLQIRAS